MAYNKLSPYCTKVISDDHGLIVRYHQTDIVVMRLVLGRRIVMLDTGGWKGVTTKRKMNQAANQFDLSYGVHQHRHEWYVTTRAGVFGFGDRAFTFNADTGVPLSA